MKKEFCEILTDFIAGGGLTPNPVEDIHDSVAEGNYDVPISRVGERHTLGGAVAEATESDYEGLSDDVCPDLRVAPKMPWELVCSYEITETEIYNHRTNS